MLVVHPVHEVIGQLPLLIGSVVLGTATGSPMWSVGVLVLMLAYGVARWYVTAYRIDTEQVQLRTGVLQRTVLSLPRNRIRSVSTDARLLHRLLGLTVVKVGTGQDGRKDAEFELDAVRVDELTALRALLVGDAPADVDTARDDAVLARWQPVWLRYSPLSFTGLATIAAALAVVHQTGVLALLRDSPLARAGLDAAQRAGVVVTVVVSVVAVLIGAALLSLSRSLVTYGNLVLARRDDGGAGVLHLEHGLLRRREHTFDVARLRGATLREPALIRIFGGARLDAVMTGVNGAGEASLLLPACPRSTATDVLVALTAPEALADLRAHGPAATRRRWTRAFAFPALLAVALACATLSTGLPMWVWVGFATFCAVSAVLAADRCRALGHRVDAGWLVARAGSLDRRRDCIAADGIIGWTVRQTLFQRRAGLATLVAATAAGVKGYRVLDVPVDVAWAVAASASPWVAGSEWAVSPAESAP